MSNLDNFAKLFHRYKQNEIRYIRQFLPHLNYIAAIALYLVKQNIKIEANYSRHTQAGRHHEHATGLLHAYGFGCMWAIDLEK